MWVLLWLWILFFVYWDMDSSKIQISILKTKSITLPYFFFHFFKIIKTVPNRARHHKSVWKKGCYLVAKRLISNKALIITKVLKYVNFKSYQTSAQFWISLWYMRNQWTFIKRKMNLLSTLTLDLSRGGGRIHWSYDLPQMFSFKIPRE